MNNEKKFKDRDLSILEYLEVLQREWWVCNLRRKIYPDLKSKNNFNRIANLKRDRIKEIAERNDIPSIFSSREEMKKLNKEFMREGGFPIFPGLTEEDICNYYLPQNDARIFLGFGENKQPIVKIGKIVSFDQVNRKVTVTFEDSEIVEFPITKVSRIF